MGITKASLWTLAIIGATWGQASTVSAQLLLPQVRQDYRQPTTYSPEDPNFRSRLFLEHTGHSGRFYNCDGEEDKRFSPYITWSTVCNQEHIRTWANVLRCDIREVKERVRSGACRDGLCETGRTNAVGNYGNSYLAKGTEELVPGAGNRTVETPTPRSRLAAQSQKPTPANAATPDATREATPVNDRVTLQPTTNKKSWK